MVTTGGKPMENQSPDQKRHVRQALADLVFGLALFVIFIILGVFGAKQATSYVGGVDNLGQLVEPLPSDHPSPILRHVPLPLGGET
jgi:hypothetical protein